jgi:hypothetical protein
MRARLPAAICQGTPFIEMLGDSNLAPPIGRRPGVPVGDPIERRAVARSGNSRKLDTFLLGRAAIGRW